MEKELPAVLLSVGKPSFYKVVGEWLADMIPSTQSIIVRYAPDGPPEFIVNEVLPPAAVSLYLSGAYKFDPLVRMWGQRQAPDCAVIRQLELDAEAKENYLDGIFRRCFIQDELALLVPAPAPAPVCVYSPPERRQSPN